MEYSFPWPDSYADIKQLSESSESSEELVVYVDSKGNYIQYDPHARVGFTPKDIISDLLKLGYKKEAITSEQVDKLFELRKAMGEESYEMIMAARFAQIRDTM